MAILNASLAVLCLHLTILGALPAMLTAQGPPPPPQLPPITKATTRTLSRIVINVAMIAFFIIVLMCLYVLCAGGSGSSGAAERQQGSVRLRRRRRGLDTVALAALAIVPYAEIKKHRSGGGGELECAVCLTAFEDGEKLRLLPQCSHAFHPDCIDPWLEVHVTCPLCRANLEKPAPAVVAPPPPETTLEAVAVQLDEEEEAVEPERLRCARRAARLKRWHTMGHSPTPSATTTATAAGGGDHERFTVRLPPHVRAEVLKSMRLRHATSLVVRQSCTGSALCARRWWRRLELARCTSSLASFLTRTPSWGRSSGGDVGTAAARLPARYKSGSVA